MTEISIENLMSHYPSLEELESKIKRNPEFHPRNNFLICRSRQKEYGHQFPSMEIFSEKLYPIIDKHHHRNFNNATWKRSV